MKRTESRLKVLLALLLLAQLAHCSYFGLVSHSLTAVVNEDGTAHVIEEMKLLMRGNDSIEKYETSMSAVDTTIDKWRRVTGVDEIRLHTDTIYVVPKNTRVLPQRRTECNILEETCYANIKIEYDTTYPLFRMNRTRPRTTNYSLVREAFSFEKSLSGEIVLPEHTNLTIQIPQDAVVTALNPMPDNVPEGTHLPLKDVYSFTWATASGRTTLTNLEIKFETVEPLDVEVAEFFSGIGGQVAGMAAEYWYLFIMGAVVGIAIVLLRRSR